MMSIFCSVFNLMHVLWCTFYYLLCLFIALYYSLCSMSTAQVANKRFIYYAQQCHKNELLNGGT